MKRRGDEVHFARYLSGADRSGWRDTPIARADPAAAMFHSSGSVAARALHAEAANPSARDIYRRLRLPDSDIRILLQATADDKASKERLHTDIETNDVEAEVHRLEALGAGRKTPLRQDHALRDVAENREVGDVTTLADSTVIDLVKRGASLSIDN